MAAAKQKFIGCSVNSHHYQSSLLLLKSRKWFSNSDERSSQFRGFLLQRAAVPTLFSHSSSVEVDESPKERNIDGL